MSLQMRCPFELQIIECTGDIDMREPSLSGPLLEAALRWGQQLPVACLPCQALGDSSVRLRYLAALQAAEMVDQST